MASSIEISAETFLNKLKSNDLNNKEFIVQDRVEISNEDSISQIFIDNIKFKKEVVFNNLKLEYGLFFENCEFQDGVKIQNVRTNTYSHNINKENCSILFSNCTCKLISISGNCEFYRGIVVHNNCKIEHLSIVETTITQNSIRIRNSEISKILEFSKNYGEINLNELELHKLRVESCNGDFSILKSNFHDWVQIWNLECPRSLVFNYNNFNDTVNIKGSRLNHLSVIGDNFQKKFRLENRDTSHGNPTHLNELYIREATFIEVGEFDGLGEQIKEIKIPITPKLVGSLKIENWKVGKVDIHGINQNLKLILSQLFMKRLSMIGFTNYSAITFERCAADNVNFKTELDPNSTIFLAHTDLGKTKFIEFDFNSFDFISVDNSSFNEIYTSNVVWFDETKLNIQDAYNNELKIAQRKREVYRQLKQSLRNNGNQIDSLEFQAREMKAYRTELKQSGNKYSYQDRIIMTVNQSNNYGINWIKPTLITLLITLFFYSIMLPLFSSNLNYSMAQNLEDVANSFSEWSTNFNVYWQMFNPARKFSIVFGEVQSGWLQFLDLFHRIILGVMIFQIIKGFRKLAAK